MMTILFPDERVWPLTADLTFLAPVCSRGPFYLDSGKTLIPTTDRGQSIAVFGAN